MTSERKGFVGNMADRFARRREVPPPGQAQGPGVPAPPKPPPPPSDPPRIETPWESYPELRFISDALERGDWSGFLQSLAALPSDDSRAYAINQLTDRDELDSLLEKTLAADPGDLDALALTGARTVIKGWAVRGAGLAKTVSREQFEEFHDHIRRADAMFRDVVARDPGNLYASIQRIITANALSMGLNEVMRRYEQAAAHHPHSYRLQIPALNANYPKWSGTWEFAYEFVQRCAASAPAGSTVPTLVLDYHVEKRLWEPGETRAKYYAQSEVAVDIASAADKSVLHPAYRKEPGWVVLCNRYAQALVGCADWPRAAGVYALLENRMVESEWTRFEYPQNAFCLYRDKGPNPAPTGEHLVIEVRETEAIPTLWVDRPGRTKAGLTFRVGQADETLAIRGITHLIEHLALFRLGSTEYHSNGATGLTLTHFYLEGTESDVVAFLRSVCESLVDLPLDRLKRECAILQTEEAGRHRPVLPGWRYGAQGYGLVSYAEWGNERLTAGEVRDWARRWFTQDNAALWVIGPSLPADLRLPLPPGERQRPPAGTSVLGSTPAWFAHGRDEVVLDSLVPRSTAATMYSAVLGRELFRALRRDGGYSYQAAAQYEPRDADTATLVAYADAHEGQDDAVLGGFVDVLAKMRAGRFEAEDVAACRAQADARLSDPDAEAARLPSVAGDLLLGRAPESLEELRSRAAAVTPADLQGVAVAAAATALLKVPTNRKADWAGFTLAPLYSSGRVRGRTYLGLGSTAASLVIATDGVSLVSGDDAVTVRFADCVARLHWPDGRRVLIGSDGFTVTVEPSLYGLDAAGLAAIDHGAAADTVVLRPARDPDKIPSPSTPTPAAQAVPAPRRSPVPDAVLSTDPAPTNTSKGGPAPWLSVPAYQASAPAAPVPMGSGHGMPAARPTPTTPADAPAQAVAHSRAATIGYWVCLTLSLLWAAVAVMATADSIQNPNAPDNDWGTTVTMWVLLAVPLVPFMILARRRGRG